MPRKYNYLNKTKIQSGLQCHKKLWFDIHEPPKKIEKAVFKMGNRFGEQVIKNYSKNNEKFLDLTNDWINQVNKTKDAINSKDINIIDGMFIGTKDTNGKPVLIEELISSNYIDMHDNICGVYIPWDELINRKKYQWFSKLTPHEVLESDTNISRFLLAYK